jgi:SAM-dependent methyltransferase
MKQLSSDFDAFAEEDFDEEMLESVSLAEGSTGVSHEFVQYQARGLQAFCWSPWRMLKVDIRSRTMVCCNFAQKLPTFEWPTAKEFHEETGMWNHPFMQYMREGMAKPSEVPYCTLCRTKDKRDIKNFDLRKRAMKETQLLFERIVEAFSSRDLAGPVDAIPEKLTEWSHRLRPHAAPIKLFLKDRLYYRRLVRTRGFCDLPHVLQVGSWNGTITPFLAERNGHVTIVDDSFRALTKATAVAHAFARDNVTAVQTKDVAALPFTEGSFDGVWLDGRLLSQMGRRSLLAEIFRLLAPGGRLQVNQCLGPGGLIEAAANGTVAIDMASAALREGPGYDGPAGFLTLGTVLAAVKSTGFVSDKVNPPAAARFAADSSAESKRDEKKLATLATRISDHSFLDTVRDDNTSLSGLERFLSFTLIKPI